jgi:hypothetical protein
VAKPASTSASTGGDGQKRSYSATFGKTFDRGWFSVGAERTKEDEVLGSEREFSRYPTARATPTMA